MDRLRALGIYSTEYMAGATQLATYRLAREWMEAGVPAADAAAWASLGYQPVEAAPLIASGVTPQMAGELDEIATSVAGSSEERAAQVIDRLVAQGILGWTARTAWRSRSWRGWRSQPARGQRAGR